MTADQFALLQDKVALWRRASTEGSMELRDYNRRAGEALTAALVERAELLGAIKEVIAHTDPEDPDSYRSDDREGCLDVVHAFAVRAVAKAEGRA